MTYLSVDELKETIDAARDFRRDGIVSLVDGRDFFAAILQLSAACTIGVPCDRHGGVVHGQEAEELRAGVEQILRNTASVQREDEESVLAAVRKSLIFLLDRVDARDSLAFREVTDPKEHEA